MPSEIFKTTRRCRRYLEGELGISPGPARDIFFADLITAYLAMVVEQKLDTSRSCRIGQIQDAIGIQFPLLERARLIGEVGDISSYLGSVVTRLTPASIGSAYQAWNQEDRKLATWAISRRGETDQGTSDIALATQLYTEPYMTSFLVHETRSRAPYRRPSEGFSVCDPACGTGHFLLEVLEQIEREYGCGEIETLLLYGLAGADIDPFSVELCRIALVLLAARLGVQDVAGADRAIVRSIVTVPEPLGSLDRDSNNPIFKRQYDCVVTNPPYLGRRKLAPVLRDYLSTAYHAAKLDLCAAFMMRCVELTADGGVFGLVTVDKWIRLKGYQAFRSGAGAFKGFYGEASIDLIVELGQRAFGSHTGLHDGVGTVLVAGRRVPPAAHHQVLLFDCTAISTIEEKRDLLVGSVAGTAPFEGRYISIDRMHDPAASGALVGAPGIPDAIGGSTRRVEDVARVVVGIQTSDDQRFVRYIWGVEPDPSRWVIHSKGGGYTRWFGLNRYVIDRSFLEELPANDTRWIESPGWTYSWFANGSLGLRKKDAGTSIGRAASSGVFSTDLRVVAFLNSRLASFLSRRLGGKVQLPEGVVRSIPLPEDLSVIDASLVRYAVELKEAIVASDPRDAAFISERSPELLRDLWMEAVLLLIEGVLEQQVWSAAKGNDRDLAALDRILAPPVAWNMAPGRDAIAQFHAHLPRLINEVVTDESVLDRILYQKSGRALSLNSSPGFKGIVMDEGLVARALKSACSFEQPALPAVSLVERLSRLLNAHPITVCLALKESFERGDSATRQIVAGQLCRAITVSSLRAVGHRWWRNAGEDVDSLQDGILLKDLRDKVLEQLARRGQTPHRVQDLLGSSIDTWMRHTLPAYQKQLFKGTALLILLPGTKAAKDRLVHARRMGLAREVFDHTCVVAP